MKLRQLINRRKLLKRDHEWAVVTEDGEERERFRLFATASQSIPRLKFWRGEKLRVVPIIR